MMYVFDDFLGKTSGCVASYETHVVVGLGAFLIVENLTIPFFLNVIIFAGGAIILLVK